jgi:hypothetical protein
MVYTGAITIKFAYSCSCASPDKASLGPSNMNKQASKHGHRDNIDDVHCIREKPQFIFVTLQIVVHTFKPQAQKVDW